MNKPQWITLSIAILLVIGLFAVTQSSIFGQKSAKKGISPVTAAAHDDGLSTDSILYYAKQNLPQIQIVRLTQLENSIVRGDVSEQKRHLMHQLAAYWRDSARAFTPMYWYPYAYYTAEAARLENSEKSLSFAAHLFLNVLAGEENHQVKHWDAAQAKDLFERSLKINPESDSAKVGLGATILYGGEESPMTGIGMIREVVERDSTNVFAQQTLGEASLMSGQLDKAVERFKTVLRLQPGNWKTGLLLADTFERMNQKQSAMESYGKTLPYLENPELKKEVEKRIAQLKTK